MGGGIIPHAKKLSFVVVVNSYGVARYNVSYARERLPSTAVNNIREKMRIFMQVW